jgi:hypothetical protein
MNYNKPRTASEFNIQHINKLLKHITIKKVTRAECESELDKRFSRLEKENIGMYEEMLPKYLKLTKMA